MHSRSGIAAAIASWAVARLSSIGPKLNASPRLHESSTTVPRVPTIPVSIDDFTPDWLSEALGEEVSAVEVERVGQGVGILGLLARLHLTFADGDSARPSRMIAKIASSNPETVAVAVHYGFYLNEVSFYRECSLTPGLRTPAVYHSDIDSTASTFVLLLEDLGSAVWPIRSSGAHPLMPHT